jgi:hypothetical protein
MSDKILFLGSSWHLTRTKSTVFIVDLLRRYFDVEIVTDKGWVAAPDEDVSFIDASYKAVIFFQVFPTKEKLDMIANDNVVFFPMYDDASDQYNWWVDHQRVKIINFAKASHERLSNWGFNSIHVQYFPEPREFLPGDRREILLWQRREEIDIDTVKRLFDGENLKLHLHKAMDPNHRFTQPSANDETRYGITYSEWFEKREELDELIARKGIYVAPRTKEGIGMSFLEAMSMGKAVVAVDRPTMNEYIRHNATGYLYDLKRPRPLDLGNIEEIQRNTYEYMQQGYRQWRNDMLRVIDFIAERPKGLNLRHKIDLEGKLRKIAAKLGLE